MKKKEKKKKQLAESRFNPTTYSDEKTEMGVPIPSDEGVENSKEWGTEHEV